MFQSNWSASQGENFTIIYVLSLIYVLKTEIALFFQNTSTEMSKNRHTAEEADELLTADNDPEGNDLRSSSDDDLPSIGEDENQPILSNSDSEASLTSDESKSDYDDELNDSIRTDN